MTSNLRWYDINVARTPSWKRLKIWKVTPNPWPVIDFWIKPRSFSEHINEVFERWGQNPAEYLSIVTCLKPWQIIHYIQRRTIQISLYHDNYLTTHWSCVVLYHLVYMNTSILLVKSQVILNRITDFKSKNILRCAFKAKTRRAKCAWCIWRACVSKALPQTGNTVSYYLFDYGNTENINLNILGCLVVCWKFVIEKLSIWFMNKIGLFFSFFNILVHNYQVINSLSLFVLTQCGKYLWMGAVSHSAYGFLWYRTHP